MKNTVIYSWLIFSFATKAYAQSYHDIWPEDYKIASSLVAENCDSFHQIALDHEIDTEEAMAVVFPELIRYSLVRDLLETSAVEFGYVKYGAGFTDFSIGQFQMKPSFIEELEEYICAHEELRSYLPLCSFSSNGAESIRAERIARLKQAKYQFQYLSCFLSVALLEYGELKDMKATERIKILATLYNAGFGHSLQKLQTLSTVKVFPYGSTFSRDQYSYAHIAQDFFLDFSL